MWRLYFTALFARIFHQPLMYSIRFIPALQARTDKRGRTISDFESLGEAIAYLADLSNRKEKVHGHYYIAIEARSQGYGHIGTGRLQDKRQADAFPTGDIGPAGPSITRRLYEGVQGEAQSVGDAADQGKAADASTHGTEGSGDDHRSEAGQGAVAESQAPVAPVKVDLSELGAG